MLVTQAATRAQNQGRDLAEYLHAHGLLATPSWTARVQAEAAQEIASAVAGASLGRILGSKYISGSWSPEDIRQGIVALITEYELTHREKV